jgi:hypothetical protein
MYSKENVRKALELLKESGVAISGCGCCGSPYFAIEVGSHCIYSDANTRENSIELLVTSLDKEVQEYLTTNSENSTDLLKHLGLSND